MRKNCHIESVTVKGRSVVFSVPSRPSGIIYFLGVGQGKKTVNQLAITHDEIVFVEALPYLSVPADDIAQFGLDVVAAICDRIGTNVMRIVAAESQAAPLAVAAITGGILSLPEHVILLSPLGLTTHQFGSTGPVKYKELMRRSRLNWRGKFMHGLEMGDWQTLFEIVSQSLRHIKNIQPAYTYGASIDISDQILSLQHKTNIDIWSSDHDPLFPLHEIRHTLKDASNVHFNRLEGQTHPNRTTTLGLMHLEQAMGSIVTDEAS